MGLRQPEAGVVYDYSGWLTVDGPRFLAFFPLGSKLVLENDMQFLLEAYNQPTEMTLRMTSSQRHRIVKVKGEIARQARSGNGGGMTPTVAQSRTGVTPTPAPRPAVPINYSGSGGS